MLFVNIEFTLQYLKLSLQFAVMKSSDCFYIHLCDSIINIFQKKNLTDSG